MSGTSSVPEIKFASASTPTIEQGFRDSIKDVLKKLNEYASDTLIVVQTFQSLVTWFNDKLTKEANSSQSNGLPPGGDWCTAFLDTDFAEGVRLLLKRSYLSSSSMYFSASASLSDELDVAFRCLVSCVDLALDLVRLDHPTGGVILCIVFEEHNAFYNRYGFDVPDDEKNKIASIGDTEEYKEFRQNKLTAGMWIDFFNGSKWFPAEVTQDHEDHIMVKVG